MEYLVCGFTGTLQNSPKGRESQGAPQETTTGTCKTIWKGNRLLLVFSLWDQEFLFLLLSAHSLLSFPLSLQIDCLHVFI